MLNKINDFDELKHKIEVKAYQPYVQQHIEKPLVDEDKLLLLWGLFNELEISTDERNHYILSTMLVQIALDTHENVSNSKMNSEQYDSIKKQQLTVLAGDYYSGLYYQVLAEVGNVQMIRSLSNAVKKINDHKILLYQHTFDSISAFLTSIEIVEASLIYKIAEYYDRPIWMKAAENILLLKRLIREKEQYTVTGQSHLVEGLRKMIFPHLATDVRQVKEQELQLETTMNSCIEYAVEAVKQSKAELSFVHVELHQRIVDLMPSIERNEIHM